MIPRVRELAAAAARSVEIGRRGWTLLATAFLVDTAFLFVFLIAVQSYLPDRLHASAAIAGWALGAFGMAKLATQLASGFIADRVGARRALMLGTGLLLAGDVSFLALAHTSPWLVVCAAAVVGLGSSVTWPALYAAADARFADSEKARFTALLTLASGGALVAGLGGGTLLETTVPFDAAMALPIACVGAACALALLGRDHDDARLVAEAPPPSLRDARAIFGERRRVGFALLVLAEAAALGALTASFRAYGRDVLGVSLAREASLLVPAAVLGALLVIPGGALADRIGRARVLAPGFATTAACLAVLSQVTQPALVIVLAGIAGGAFGLALPAIAATMMSLASDSANRGGVIGWFMMMDGIGHATGPVGAAVLIAAFDASAVLLACGGLFAGVAAIAVASQLKAVRTVRIDAVEAQAA